VLYRNFFGPLAREKNGMLNLLCLLFVFQNPGQHFSDKDERAINIALNSPAIDLPVVSLINGRKLNFKDFGDEGLTFFLTPQCEFCKRSYDLLMALGAKYHCYVIFAGKQADVISFLDEKQVEQRDNVFLVDAKLLVPFNIRRVPAVLGFKGNKLSMAMHGPLNMEDYGTIVQLHENNSLVERNPKSK